MTKHTQSLGVVCSSLNLEKVRFVQVRFSRGFLIFHWSIAIKWRYPHIFKFSQSISQIRSFNSTKHRRGIGLVV